MKPKTIDILDRKSPAADKQGNDRKAYGFSPKGYNQIIVFNNWQDFKESVDANANMVAIMGSDGHTRKAYPGVYIAAVTEEDN